MKIYPLLLALFLAACMLAVHFLVSNGTLTGAPLSYFGASLMVLCVLMVFWSAGVFRRRNTTLNPTGEPSALATEGLYRVSRNPMYLGMLLGLLGLTAVLGDAALAAGPALFAWVTTCQIRREESVLEQRFGAVYLAYKARVRRWL
jgi:protein-S-isoprenylcysteine O-methyltransferase Ste14